MAGAWRTAMDLSIRGDFPGGMDDDLVELSWQKGGIVMNSQTQRRAAASLSEAKNFQKTEANPKYRDPFEGSIREEDERETATWLHYSIEDSLDGDFCPEFYGLPAAEQEGLAKHGAAVAAAEEEDGAVFGDYVFSLPSVPGLKEGEGMRNQAEESSSSKREEAETNGPKGKKRKGVDAGESECLTEEAGDCESVEASRRRRRSASSRRARAAEVHNLAERRRRDRINEKMKALQELIPHCNKSDKASMLDEAIEYLKSLQLQLQFSITGR
ncbi:unnamed protein product [Spirodela intermedia]|uniref:BHLH domain-containing protein n=2 Tax=Spirodela intermedia TaxID=51605 RepID=A0A7I8K8I3_SPIIN|nr:unnamed protein product [Spirodela intermedia]CAA6657947.1 unnamed protein product [Spirodela intermedia]CAA7394079.1 unnamed protein product [Spirodela intermedia]